MPTEGPHAGGAHTTEAPSEGHDLAVEYHALRHAAASTELVGRGAVRISGPDAASFLQSLVSADLDPLGDGDGVHSLLLSPQGKLDVDFRLLRVGEVDWLALTDTADAPRLVASLTRFKIRVSVEIHDESASCTRLEVRGPGAAEALAVALGRFDTPGPDTHVVLGDVRVVASDWPGSPAFEVLGAPGAVGSVRDRLAGAGVVAAGEDAREAVRIESGVPRGAVDLDDSVIPQEAFLHETAVSFTKGCFLGQELVCRIDTRGRVNRYLRGLTGDMPLHSASEVVVDGATVGRVTSAAKSPERGAVALAFVRREVEPPVPVTVRRGGEDVPARLVELPIVGSARP